MRRYFIIIAFISISLLFMNFNLNTEAQTFYIVLDKRFYKPLDTMHLTIYGPRGKYISIEIRDAQNILVFWTQTIIWEKGYTTINITIPEYWRYGKYILYASILGGKKISTIFMVYGKPAGNIILYTLSNITEIYRNNSIYIILNPPKNTSIILTISTEKHIYIKLIHLENGFKKISIRFNETGTYILNACWSGDEYYNHTSAVSIIEVIENITANILNYNIYLNTSAISINRPIEFTAYPWINLSEIKLVIYSPYSEKHVYSINNTLIFRPNFPGIWIAYLYSLKNGLKSLPKIFYVKDAASMFLKCNKNRIYRGEKVEFTVKIGLEKCFGKIDLYLLENDRWIYLNSTYIYNGTGKFYWRAGREGTYLFKAVWSGNIAYSESESNIVKIYVVSKTYRVFLIILDGEDRILDNTRITIGGRKYSVRSGIAYLTLKENLYNVSILWRNTIIYSGYLNICRAGYYKIKCDVYDLRIRMVDWMSNPISNQKIVIEGNNIRLEKLTNSMGEVVFKQLPIGNYTVKTDIGVKKIYLDKAMTIMFKGQPPWNLIITAIAIILSIPIIYILRKYVKIEIIIEKEE